jgi:hypothetical protein
MTPVGFLAANRGRAEIRPENPSAVVDRLKEHSWWACRWMLAGLRGLEPGVNAGSFRRLRDDECDLRGERRSSSGLSGRKAERLDGDPYNLIRSTVDGNSSPRLVAHRPAVGVRRSRRSGVVWPVGVRRRRAVSNYRRPRGTRFPKTGQVAQRSSPARQAAGATPRSTRQGRLGVTGACTASVSRPASELSFNGGTGRQAWRRRAVAARRPGGSRG